METLNQPTTFRAVDARRIEKRIVTMDRDYMIYCMSYSLSPTLATHFGEEYNSYVVITGGAVS